MTGGFDGSTSAGWNHSHCHADRGSSEAACGHSAPDRTIETTATPKA